MTPRTDPEATGAACDRTAPDRTAQDRPTPGAPWRPLTRRAFVAALAAAAAALALDEGRGVRALGGDCDDDRPRRRSTTVWIGHC